MMTNIKLCSNLNKSNTYNKGFTLIELIVCVGILIIASIPIAQSFGRAQKVNAKAQSMQNATSLAESIMEEIKGTSITDLVARYPSELSYDATSDSYTLTRSAVPSRQGERFDVVANIVSATYKTTDEDSDGFEDETENAKDANSIRLPNIEEIDTTYMSAISSQEINKYDQAAKDYFDEYSLNKRASAISQKDIDITKVNEAGAVLVKCSVTYYSSDSPRLEYTREVYTGSYVPNSEGKVPNNIYIFYRRYLSGNENITVKDTSTLGSHKVYLIMQDGVTDISGTTVSVETSSGELIHVDSNSDLGTGTPGVDKPNDIQKGRKKSGDYELITNLDAVGTEGNIFEEKQRNHIYEVTVELREEGGSEVIASLTSTKNVDPR